MNNRTILIVLVLLLIFGVGGHRFGDGGPLYAGGGVGLALIIILVLFLLGVL